MKILSKGGGGGVGEDFSRGGGLSVNIFRREGGVDEDFLERGYW